MKLLPQEDNYFGLDLGSSSIKIAQLRELHGSPSLVTYGDIEVASNLLSSDSEIDQNRVSELIKQLAQDAKVTTKNVVASLSASQSYTAIIRTPKLSHNELAESIKFQADKVIPMAMDQVKLDWAVVGEVPETDEVDVLLVAAPNNTANKYLNIIQKAGLELLALEINPIAQSRSLIGPADKPKCIIIVDIGSVASDIAILSNTVPQLVRSVAIGSKALNRVVSQNLGIDAGQADQFIKKFGMDQTKIEGQVFKTLKPVVDHLVEEINKSITFFQEKNPTQRVEKIILTGGTTALPGLPLYLANATGLTIEVGNPWQNISYPKELESSLAGLSLSYATAIGLAMRNFQK
ncbi:MAG: type IV pilus assembly protein PilM [Patescibacteria group bacterium]|jgi:type IV pilus assembly protein PilM|nr:type IV pilus assembly protein PilM [Patescibacteria group bacterium]